MQELLRHLEDCDNYGYHTGSCDKCGAEYDIEADCHNFTCHEDDCDGTVHNIIMENGMI